MAEVVKEMEHAPACRDEVLRFAHKKAFDKIRLATGSENYEHMVGQAIDELIDACERYTAVR